MGEGKVAAIVMAGAGPPATLLPSKQKAWMPTFDGMTRRRTPQLTESYPG